MRRALLRFASLRSRTNAGPCSKRHAFQELAPKSNCFTCSSTAAETGAARSSETRTIRHILKIRVAHYCRQVPFRSLEFGYGINAFYSCLIAMSVNQSAKSLAV
jgi:hypothetical protein